MWFQKNEPPRWMTWWQINRGMLCASWPHPWSATWALHGQPIKWSCPCRVDLTVMSMGNGLDNSQACKGNDFDPTMYTQDDNWTTCIRSKAIQWPHARTILIKRDCNLKAENHAWQYYSFAINETASKGLHTATCATIVWFRFTEEKIFQLFLTPIDQTCQRRRERRDRIRKRERERARNHRFWRRKERKCAEKRGNHKKKAIMATQS